MYEIVRTIQTDAAIWKEAEPGLNRERNRHGTRGYFEEVWMANLQGNILRRCADTGRRDAHGKTIWRLK